LPPIKWQRGEHTEQDTSRFRISDGFTAGGRTLQHRVGQTGSLGYRAFFRGIGHTEFAW